MRGRAMLLVIDPAQALRLIDAPRLAREDGVVPMAFPEHADSPYQPEYGWLFLYERQIAAFLEAWLRPFRYELIGGKGILCEALSNAFCHGHNKDPRKPITVRVWLGNRGLIVQIQDCGPGFDVQSVYQRFLHHRDYFSTAGNGLRLMDRSQRFGVFHDATGRRFHLLYFFSDSLDQLPAKMFLDADRFL
ncbi:MAG: ATP-binding protein [Desulfobacterales bacterium]|nr:ATP-binding protein [Desulfobacterales bacterium]